MKEILKDNDINGKEMADLLGITYDSYRTLTKPSAKHVPKWVRAFVIGYELAKKW